MCLIVPTVFAPGWFRSHDWSCLALNARSFSLSLSLSFFFSFSSHAQVTTTVAAAERLLQSSFHRFTHRTASHLSIHRLIGPYTLPPAIASAVDVISPTLRFPSVRRRRGQKKPQLSRTDRAGHRGINGDVTPAFLKQLYAVGDYRSTNHTNSIGALGFLGEYMVPSDLQEFLQQLRRFRL
jgi:hypothetical protein